MPSHTKIVFDLETIELALDLPQVVGLKDSGNDLCYFHRVSQVVRRRRPDWSLLIGPEELLGETVLLGADGGVCGGANLDPRLYVSIYEAARAGDAARVRELSARVWALSRALYGFGVHRSLKCALQLLGVCSDLPAEPYQRLRESERLAVRQHLAVTGLLQAEAAAVTV